MAELEETWATHSFYDLPLSVWDSDVKDAPVLDIYTASSIGNFQCIKDLLKQNPKVVEENNKGGWSALMYAAYYGHTEVVTLLLEYRSPINFRNKSGCNALMLSVVCGNEPVVDILIKAGSNLESRDERDWTVLLHAASAGQHNVVERLLQYGANPNACEKGSGMTCLMYAAKTGDQHVVNILLAAGAVTHLMTHRGHTAARIASDAGHTSIAHHIAQYTHQGNVIGPSISDGPEAVANKILQQQQQQQLRSKGNSLQTIDNCPPSNLPALLEQLSLSTYLPVLQEQGVDLQLFLTLTDHDLKDCGISKLGPRRKMTSAIARWHSSAPLGNTLEGAYADKLEVEMQELAVKLSDAQGAIQQSKTQVTQEKELRTVTEGWVVEARGRLQQCHQQCRTLNDLVARAHQYISLVNMQAGVGQHQLGQPTLASTIADTLALIGSQVESISSLTDPNIARGFSNIPNSPGIQPHSYSNPNSPRVQPQQGYSNPSSPRVLPNDTVFTNQTNTRNGLNVPTFISGNPSVPQNQELSGDKYNIGQNSTPNHGPNRPNFNSANPPPHYNRTNGPNYNNGTSPALHNKPGGTIYNNAQPPPSLNTRPSGHRYKNENINMNNSPSFPQGSPYYINR